MCWIDINRQMAPRGGRRRGARHRLQDHFLAPEETLGCDLHPSLGGNLLQRYRRQLVVDLDRALEAGIDCIGDVEFWTARSLAHYTAHFTGIEARPVAPGEPPTTRHSTRERDEFPDFYADCDRAGTLFLVPGEKPMPPVTVRVVARGSVKSKGPEAINRQLDTFKAAIARSGAQVEEAFVPVLAPGWLDHFIFNEYYQTEEEFLFALADALREEYRAVVAAGFILQIDDPGLPDWWDMLQRLGKN
jgi:5-methyltetrahydropteroyltriglutamate--homocysteine methyltransferase